MAMSLQFEWDDGKAAANETKHGVPFAFASRVFLDPSRIELDSFRPEDGENRMKAVGRIDGRLFTIVFVMRGMVCRIISARRSNGGEEKRYAHHKFHP